MKAFFSFLKGQDPLYVIEQQLHPERINDSAVEARLDKLETLDMSTQEIAREYFLPALMERRNQKREQAENPPPDPNAAGTPRSRQANEAFMKQRQVMGELSEQKILRAVYSERQLQEVLVDNLSQRVCSTRSAGPVGPLLVRMSHLFGCGSAALCSPW